jgi:hypothetical protein
MPHLDLLLQMQLTAHPSWPSLNTIRDKVKHMSHKTYTASLRLLW